MITIKEIAKLAKTSHGTVDRVIHNRSGVSKKTRERILNIMKEHNYHHNIYARALVNKNKNYKIGVVLTSAGNEFFEKVIEGIYNAYQQDYINDIELLIKETKGYDEKQLLKAIDSLLESDINGLIITPILADSIIEKLSMLTIPIVTLISDVPIDNLAFVGCDYNQSGALCGDIANMIVPNGKALVVYGTGLISSHKQRIEGFKSRFSNNGQVISKHIENNDDEEISYQEVKTYLKSNSVELVYFAAGGIKGGLEALNEMGYQNKIITVDETKAVVEQLKTGFISATITQQPFKQGEWALNILREYLIFKRKPNQRINYVSNIIKVKSSTFNETDELKFSV